MDTGHNHWESFIMRILYFIIIVTHVPPIFFPGKEAVLIMIDEIDRRSISNTLEQRIKQLKMIEANEKLEIEDGDELDKSIKEELESAGRVSASQNTRTDGSQMRRSGEDTGVAVRKTAHRNTRMSSHQSMIRAHKNTSSMIGRASKASIVSTVRETQTLMAVIRSSKKDGENLRNSSLNENENLGGEEQEISNKLAYKDMKDIYYYSSSILCLATTCFLACVVPNVSIVFNLVSIVSCNCTSFFFPSLFYITAAKRYYASRENLLQDHGEKNTRSTSLFIPYNKQLMGWAYF